MPKLTRAQARAIHLIRREIRSYHARTSSFPFAWEGFAIRPCFGGSVSVSGLYTPQGTGSLLQLVAEAHYHFFVGVRGGISTYVPKGYYNRGHLRRRRSLRLPQVPFACTQFRGKP